MTVVNAKVFLSLLALLLNVKSSYFSYKPSYLDLFWLKMGRGECWWTFLGGSGWWWVDSESILGGDG